MPGCAAVVVAAAAAADAAAAAAVVVDPVDAAAGPAGCHQAGQLDVSQTGPDRLTAAAQHGSEGTAAAVV